MKTQVTYEAVVSAAESLEANGENATYQAVLGVLKQQGRGGSLTTIGRHLRAWRALGEPGAPPHEEELPLNPTLQRQLEAAEVLGAPVLSGTKAALRAAYAAGIQRQAEAVHDLEERLGQALVQVADVEAQRDDLLAAQGALQAHVATLLERVGHLQAQAERVDQQLTEASAQQHDHGDTMRHHLTAFGDALQQVLETVTAGLGSHQDELARGLHRIQAGEAQTASALERIRDHMERSARSSTTQDIALAQINRQVDGLVHGGGVTEGHLESLRAEQRDLIEVVCGLQEHIAQNEVTRRHRAAPRWRRPSPKQRRFR